MSRVWVSAGAASVTMLALIAYLIGRMEPPAIDASEALLVSASVDATTKAMKFAAKGEPVEAVPPGMAVAAKGEPVEAAPPRSAVEGAVSAWGEIEDADHDCHFLEKDGKLTIRIPPTLHDLAAEYRTRNAPRVMREVSGNFWAEVKVDGDLRVRGVTNSSMYAAYHGCGLVVWIDSENYVRLERGNVNRHPKFAPITSYSYVTLELRENGRKALGPQMVLLDQSGTDPGSQDRRAWHLRRHRPPELSPPHPPRRRTLRLDEPGRCQVRGVQDAQVEDAGESACRHRRREHRRGQLPLHIRKFEDQSNPLSEHRADRPESGLCPLKFTDRAGRKSAHQPPCTAASSGNRPQG